MAELKYVETIGKALNEKMQRDERVFAIGEDVGVFGGVWGTNLGFLEKYSPIMKFTVIIVVFFSGLSQVYSRNSKLESAGNGAWQNGERAIWKSRINWGLECSQGRCLNA